MHFRNTPFLWRRLSSHRKRIKRFASTLICTIGFRFRMSPLWKAFLMYVFSRRTLAVFDRFSIGGRKAKTHHNEKYTFSRKTGPQLRSFGSKTLLKKKLKTHARAVFSDKARRNQQNTREDQVAECFRTFLECSYNTQVLYILTHHSRQVFISLLFHALKPLFWTRITKQKCARVLCVLIKHANIPIRN